MEENRKPSPLAKYWKQLGTIVMTLLILVPAANLITYLGCSVLVCEVDNLYWYVSTLTAFVILLSVGFNYWEQAVRIARGRQAFRPVSSSGFNWQTVWHLPFQRPASVPMQDETDRGWQVPFSNGSETVKVNVFKMELYNWLRQAYTEQPRLQPRQSAISQRSNRQLDKLQWAARIELLKRANCISRNSNSLNSTPYLKQFEGMSPIEAAWHIVDGLLEELEPSRKIW